MWTVFAAFVGILVAGAVIRTWDRTTRTAEAHGNGRGQAQQVEGVAAGPGQGQGQSQSQSQGQGQGRGRLAEANGDGHEDCDGEHEAKGQGQGQSQGQGQGQGRDQGQDQSQGQGQGQGNGWANDADVDRVSEWLTVEGVVVSIEESVMTVQTTDGETVLVEGRPWQFVREQGFDAEVGDRVVLMGFHEDGEFKTGRIDDVTNGQSVELRDESGRPGWSGQGWRQEGGQPGH
jgi:hypothetical protein